MNLNLWELYTNWTYPIVPIGMIAYTIISFTIQIYGLDNVKQLIPSTILAVVMSIVISTMIQEYTGDQFINSLEFIYACIPMMFLSIMNIPGLMKMIQKNSDNGSYQNKGGK